MTVINLHDYYSWYKQDEFVEVSDDVAAELLAGKHTDQAHERRMRRNKTYSLDEAAENEASEIAYCTDSPEAVFGMMEQHCGLCRALNSLPEIQGRRVEAYYLFGKSQRQIAEDEGVSERNVRESISRGLAGMKKYLQNS